MPVRHSDLVAFSRTSATKEERALDQKGAPGPTFVEDLPNAERSVVGASERRQNRSKHFDSAQQERNVQLKSSVLELEDLIQTTSEVQVEGIRSAESLLNLRVGNSKQALVDFDDRFRFPTSSKFSREKLIQLLDLQTSTSALQRVMRSLQKIEKIAFVTQGPSDGPGAADSEDEGPSEQRSAVSSVADMFVPSEVCGPTTNAAAEEVEGLCAELARQLTADEVNQLGARLGDLLASFFPPHGGTMGRNLFAINSICNTDVNTFVRDQLSCGEQSMRDAVAVADAAEEDFKRALQDASTDEGVQRAADCLEACVSAHDAALRMAKARLGQVLMNRSDEGNLRNAFEKARDDTAAWIAEQRELKTAASRAASHDLQAVKQQTSGRVEEHEQHSASFEEWQTTSFTSMDEHGALQEKLWREVEERVAQIGEISSKRQDLVTEHLKRSEEEWKRRRFHDEYMAVQTTHQAHLEAVQAVSQLGVGLLDTLQDSLDQLATSVESKDMSEGLDDLRRVELARFAELYPVYAVTANRLLAKVDGRSLMAARAARLAEANAKLTADVSDPKRAQYLKEAKERSAAAEQLEARSRSLAASIETWDGVAEGLAQECKEADIAFDVSHEKEVAEWEAVVRRARDEEARVQAEERAALEDQESRTKALERAAAEQSIQRQQRRQAKRESSQQPRASSARPAASAD